MKKINLLLLFILILIGLVKTLHSHEFIIKPDKTFADKEDLKISVVSAHVFMISEEIEPVEHVKVNYINKNEQKDIQVTKNESKLSLEGSIKINSNNTAFITAHREGIIWCNTKSGWKQQSKKGLQDVLSSGKYEKFAKTLINSQKGNDYFKKQLGHKLEIIPLTNPAEVQVGDNMTFKILYNGEPLTGDVYATYDGFTKNPNSYAYFTESNKEGIAHVQITKSGLWMIRAQKSKDEVTEDYDKHVLRATFVFEINGQQKNMEKPVQKNIKMSSSSNQLEKPSDKSYLWLILGVSLIGNIGLSVTLLKKRG